MKPLIKAVLFITVAFVSHAKNYDSSSKVIKNYSTEVIGYSALSGINKNAIDIDPNEDTLRRRKELSSQDSLRLNNFRRISRTTPVNRSAEIKTVETEIPSTPKKVKNVSVNNESEEADYVNMPELDLIISQYKENQREIKLAKSLNDLETLDELEQKSTSIKTNFVSIYKSTDPKKLNPEYRGFYLDFEKDILTK